MKVRSALVALALSQSALSLAGTDEFGRKATGFSVLKDQQAYFERTFQDFVTDPDGYLEGIAKVNKRLQTWVLAWQTNKIEASLPAGQAGLPQFYKKVDEVAEKQAEELLAIREDLNRLQGQYAPKLAAFGEKRLNFELPGYASQSKSLQGLTDSYVSTLNQSHVEAEKLLARMEQTNPEIKRIFREKVRIILLQRNISDIDGVLQTIDTIFQAKSTLAPYSQKVKAAFAQFNKSFLDLDYFAMQKALTRMNESCSSYNNAASAFKSSYVEEQARVIRSACSQSKTQFDSMMAGYESPAGLVADAVEYVYAPAGREACKSTARKVDCSKVRWLLGVERSKILSMDLTALEQLNTTWYAALNRGY